MKIAVGSDHAAVGLKETIISYLETWDNITVNNLGTYSNERDEYPVYAERVANAVADGTCERGILLCGTGAGMCLAANKVNGIRAVVCSEPYTAKLSMEHNNANVLCIGARVVGDEMAKMIVASWLNAEFQGGRHQKRVDMIMEIENKNRSK